VKKHGQQVQVNQDFDNLDKQSLRKEPDKIPTAKSKEEYIKFNNNDKKRFYEWAIKTKAIGLRKGWVKALTKNIHRQSFLLCPGYARLW